MAVSARKKKIFPPVFPNDPVGAEFCKWFWSLNKGWDWIVSDNPAPGSKARWITEPYPIQPNELWRRHQDKSELVGVCFKNLTRYINLDIDRGSAYHPYNNPTKYAELLRVLSSIGLNSPVVFRSSWSEGLHIYYPLPKAVSSFGVACAVKWTLFDQGILLGSGQIETFPNAKSYARSGEFTQYKSHRLPLQPESGSYLLDATLEPYSDSVEDLLDEFNAAAAQQNLKLLRQVLEASWKRQALSRGFGSSERAQKWRRHLERQITTGWTAFSQTNSQIKDIATYGRVFVRLDGRTLINYTVENAMSAPGYEQFCRHQGEIWRRAADWCKCVEAYYWPYGSDPNRSGRYSNHFHCDYNNDCPRPENNIVDFPTSNDKRSDQAQERIRQAVAHLESSDSLPSTATARSHAIIAASKLLTGTGISQTTLHKPKNLLLWHPDHYFPLDDKCVIDPPEQVTAASSAQAYPIEPDPWLEQKSSEPALLKGFPQNYTLFPFMKGLCLPPASAAPKAQADAPDSENSSNLLKCSEPITHKEIKCLGKSGAVDFGDNSALSVEISGSAAPTVASAVLTLAPTSPTVAPDVPTEPAAKEDFRQVARLRVQAIAHSQKVGRQERLAAGRFIKGPELKHLEKVAQMQFYWESGSPTLRAEARAWAAANPGVKPEVGASDPPAFTSSPVLSASGPGEAPAVLVSLPKDEPLKVGSRVIWDDCPAHCASWNPFTIIRIFDGMALLDVYERPVPLSELRQAPNAKSWC